jgi:hypothetical protein
MKLVFSVTGHLVLSNVCISITAFIYDIIIFQAPTHLPELKTCRMKNCYYSTHRALKAGEVLPQSTFNENRLTPVCHANRAAYISPFYIYILS